MHGLQTVSMPLAWWFAETTLVASALALVAHLAGRVRGAGPALRHLLWLVVLAKLMTPPLLHWPWSSPLPSFGHAEARATPRVAILQVNRVTPPAPRPLEADESPDALVDRRPEAEAGGPGPGRVEELLGVRASWPAIGSLLMSAWIFGSLVVGVEQLRRIVRFREMIRDSSPAPGWLAEEAERIGRQLSVKVPTIQVVDRLGTPLLWCLGRPVLLVPAALLKTLEAGRWRGVLAHELAHLRRGDPWVGRLELVALLAWWWNPLYWLARRRVDFEAELACDAWVLWALPGDRIEYAESLVRICTSPPPARMPSPALGVAGPGRSFERRLIMILRDRVPHDAPLPALLAATLLAAIAFPSWTVAAQAPDEAAPTSPVIVVTVNDDDDAKPAPDPKPVPKVKDVKVKVDARIKAKKDADAKARSKGESPGPTFEIKVEAFGAKLGKELEEQFGPGSDFEKQMEAFGKEMEEKFGPEFEKKMEAFGKEMAEKFGPGSDFEKKMKDLGEKAAREAGPELEKMIKEKAEAKADAAKDKANAAKDRANAARLKADAAKARVAEGRGRVERSPAPARAKADETRRARRIEMLESRINDMLKELKQLKDEKDSDEEDEVAEKEVD